VRRRCALFLERGFDRVTVAQIAAAAEVSEKTVYNCLPDQAHLAFDDDQAVLDGLVAALRDRAAGESALTAVRRALSALANRMGEGRPAGEHAAFRRMVTDSTALRTHQQAITTRYELALADVLAELTGAPTGATEPFIAAVAVVRAPRAGFETGDDSGGVGVAINRALDLLEAGLAGYAVAEHESASPPSRPARPTIRDRRRPDAPRRTTTGPRPHGSQTRRCVPHRRQRDLCRLPPQPWRPAGRRRARRPAIHQPAFLLRRGPHRRRPRSAHLERRTRHPRRTFTNPIARQQGRLGAASVLVGIAVFTFEHITDGVAGQDLAEDWATATPADQANLELVAETAFTILRGPSLAGTIILWGLPLMLFGRAAMLERYPTWLGWAGLALGAVTVLGAAALLFSPDLFPGALVYGLLVSVIVQIWTLVLGITMWRRADVASTADDGAAPA